MVGLVLGGSINQNGSGSLGMEFSYLLRMKNIEWLFTWVGTSQALNVSTVRISRLSRGRNGSVQMRSGTFRVIWPLTGLTCSKEALFEA